MLYHTTEFSPRGGRHLGTFDDLRAAVTRAIRTCEDRKFDVIAVQGVSGMSLGFPLALSLDKPIVVIRKQGEDNHWGDSLICGVAEDDLTGKKCLFVDDFISMGSTRARVAMAVEGAGGRLVAEYTAREDAYIER